MELVLNLPADLEAVLKMHAEQAGLGIHEYVLQTLRRRELNQASECSISTEQFEASLKRLHEIHAKVPATFDDSRDSIYQGR